MNRLDAGAVVVAAGKGERFGGKKTFELLCGKTVLERAFTSVAGVERVGPVVVVVADEDMDSAKELLSRFDKLWKVVAGGKRRQESVERGFRALPEETKLILVHDGSRPLATAELARRVLEGTEEWGACVPALPVVETLKRGSPDRPLVAETVPREGLFSVQTPQGFEREVLEEALELAREGRALVTDEAALVEARGRPVALVEGERVNIKLTYREDLALAEALLACDAPRPEVSARGDFGASPRQGSASGEVRGKLGRVGGKQPCARE